LWRWGVEEVVSGGHFKVVNDKTRYDTSDLPENQFEPGSDGAVLRNLRGITSRHEMELAETRELLRATEEALDTYSLEHRFTAADICALHQNWLGSIYGWAGRYRQVMMSKGGFPFAAPVHIPSLMAEYERTALMRFTPCQFADQQQIALALATVHAELVLIHPFREGNGRLARLLSTLMGLQAGLPILRFSLMDEQRERYFAAVQAGLDLNYEPMRSLFAEIIERCA
jgi:cell filamentation protein